MMANTLEEISNDLLEWSGDGAGGSFGCNGGLVIQPRQFSQIQSKTAVIPGQNTSCGAQVSIEDTSWWAAWKVLSLVKQCCRNDNPIIIHYYTIGSLKAISEPPEGLDIRVRRAFCRKASVNIL